ncbi:Uu.00g111000.m01.CDS01 [Anthostomella pinea]|uniref:Uu.00g111000.m01.CDS01 n=1 Tax=Anthostomella pinea TaxID=933095 RepID=A0AAI8YGG3_9PEZI|nr:Uu.00g111000.m01.CDS01 [Anthostomella pinea]
MEALLPKRITPSFPNWTQTPIPNLQVSSAGLLALADLGTIAQRTRIVGGSSWLDALLLAPGLHYQQAADALVGGGGGGGSMRGGAGGGDPVSSYSAVELVVGGSGGEGEGGKTTTYNITNAAMLQYLRRVSRAGERVVVDVGMLPKRDGFYSWRSWGMGGPGSMGSGSRSRRRRSSGGGRQRATIWQDEGADLGWLSHVLYLASPVLTVAAVVFMILLREWWGVGLLLALMFSRILNIWVIKQRCQPPPSPPSSPHAPSQHPNPSHPPDQTLPNLLTEYTITPPTPPSQNQTTQSQSQNQSQSQTITLRGLPTDLQAVTTAPWLAHKTHVDGYLEAMAKLTVYLVAALSGNMTQVGSVIFLALLLLTAGLLGLSNAHARTLRMHGRVVVGTVEDKGGMVPGRGGGKRGDGRKLKGDDRQGAGAGAGARYPNGGEDGTSWPASDDLTSSGISGMDDFAERGQVGRPVRDRRLFDDSVEYK